MIGLWCSSALMCLLFFELSLQCLLVQVEFIQFRFDLSRSCLEVDSVNSDSVVTGGTGGKALLSSWSRPNFLCIQKSFQIFQERRGNVVRRENFAFDGIF